jgi:hypothetical protein
LLERVVRVEPVDLRQPDGRQQARDREQVRIRERNRVARDKVRREVEREEETRVGQRGRRDDGLAGDVDAGKSDGRQDSDDDQERELPVAKAQGPNLR